MKVTDAIIYLYVTIVEWIWELAVFICMLEGKATCMCNSFKFSEACLRSYLLISGNFIVDVVKQRTKKKTYVTPFGPEELLQACEEIVNGEG